MKRIIIAVFLCAVSIGTNAQIKIKEIQHEADTLLLSAQRGMESESILDLFKGQKGYLFRVNSTNIFDPAPSFYLGETKTDAINSLKELLKLCDNDIATTILIEDSIGNTFHIRTAYMAAVARKPTFVKSDRLHIKNMDMAGYMSLNRKTIEEVIKFLEK